MKKLTSLEDTATITITGREAVMLRTLVGASSAIGSDGIFFSLSNLLEETEGLGGHGMNIDYIGIQSQQEAIAFPETKKDLMLKELQSKMDALQCEIDKIKGEKF